MVGAVIFIFFTMLHQRIIDIDNFNFFVHLILNLCHRFPLVRGFDLISQIIRKRYSGAEWNNQIIHIRLTIQILGYFINALCIVCCHIIQICVQLISGIVHNDHTVIILHFSIRRDLRIICSLTFFLFLCCLLCSCFCRNIFRCRNIVVLLFIFLASASCQQRYCKCHHQNCRIYFFANHFFNLFSIRYPLLY